MLMLIVTTTMAVVAAVLALISPDLWWVYLIFGACLLLLFFGLPRFIKNSGPRFCTHCGRRNTAGRNASYYASSNIWKVPMLSAVWTGMGRNGIGKPTFHYDEQVPDHRYVFFNGLYQDAHAPFDLSIGRLEWSVSFEE